MSAYGGASWANSKNQSKSNNQFQQQIDPTMLKYWGDMAYRLGHAQDYTQAGVESEMPWATQRAGEVYDTSKPSWEQQMRGGAYESLDAPGIFGQLMSSLAQPTNSQQVQQMYAQNLANNAYADPFQNPFATKPNSPMPDWRVPGRLPLRQERSRFQPRKNPYR